MTRLCQLSLFVLCLAGLGSPGEATAQFMSWGYDWGTPYSAGYSSYGYSGYYGTPYSTSYAPGIGCSSCQSSVMYASNGCGCSPCGCSPCGGGCSTGCASGNCSTGNCATTTNLAPNEPIAPVPDPKNGSRTIEQRLRAIERELKIVAPSTPETYTPDDFNSVPGSRGAGTGTTIPSRRNNDTQFEMPPRGKATDTEGEMFEQNSPEPRSSLKPPISGASGAKVGDSGIPIPSKSNGDESSSKKPAPGEPIDEGKGQSLRLDSRVTSRAVSPRQRLAMPMGLSKPAVVARKPATKLQVDVQPRTANVARY